MLKGLQGKAKKVVLGLGTFVLVGTIGTGILISSQEPIQSNALQPSAIVSEEKAPVEKKAESQNEKQAEDKDVVVAEDNTVTEGKEEVQEVANAPKVEKEETAVEKPVVNVQEKKETKTTTKTSTVTENISFQTVTQNDNTIAKGQKVVAQYGQNGTKTITYEETYVNGQLTSKRAVSSNITKNPVSQIVKVGTQVTSQAKQTLSGSGLFAQNGNTFVHFIDNSIVVKVTMNGDKVSSIYFDGNAYYGWDYITEQLLINENGEAQGKAMYKEVQQDLRSIELAIRTAANAAYGKGTAKANALYNEIIKGGETQLGYTKNF